MRGCCFISNSDFGNINSMNLEMANALRENGADIEIIDTRLPDAGKMLFDHLVSGDLSFIFTINNIGLPSQADSPIVKAINMFNIPVFSWYVDHPFVNSIDQSIPIDNHIMGINCPQHLEFHKVSNRVPHKKTVLMPHPCKNGNVNTTEERDIPILFVGTGNIYPEKLRNAWVNNYGQSVSDNLNRMVEAYQHHGNKGLQHILNDVFTNFTLMPWQNVISYCSVFDDYLRALTKRNAAKMVFEIGGTVIGPNWENIVEDNNKDRFLGEQPIEKVKGFLQRSHAVVNPLPTYYQWHERLPYALETGAVPISPACSWNREQLDNCIVHFDFATGTTQDFEACNNSIPNIRMNLEAAYTKIKNNLSYKKHAENILTHITA